MRVITYATHSEGTFENLRGDPRVTVLGWGTKWTGYTDKNRGVLNFLKTQPDDELVVYIDGFDSRITTKSFDTLEEDFNSFNCEVLFSLDDTSGISNFVPGFLERYCRRRIFGVCRDGANANCGLYMGRARYLHMVLAETMKGGPDDQRNLNLACDKFPFLKIDVDKRIFENCSTPECHSNAYFIQVPASITVKRVLRGIADYSLFFIPEFIVVIMIIWWTTR